MTKYFAGFIMCGLGAVLSLAAAPLFAASAADDPPADVSTTVSTDAKAVGTAVKRDAKAVAKAAKDGAHQVAGAAKEIAHKVAAASKQGAHEVADAAKRGAKKVKAAVKADKPGKSDDKPAGKSDHTEPR